MSPRSPAPTARRLITSTAIALALLAAAVAVALTAPPDTPAAATTGSPTACERVIDGIDWTLDPCVAEGDPLPPDLADVLAQLRACPSTSPDPTTATTQTVAARRAATGPDAALTGSAPPTTTSAPPTTAPPTTAPPTTVPPTTGPPTSDPSPTSAPPTSPTDSPTPSPSDSPQCPVLEDPQPWPGYPPPGSPGPSSSTPPTDSPTPPTPTPSDPPDTCAAGATPTGPAVLAEAPKDESADRIHCRVPADPKKPGITLIAAGNSLVSAHHQTGFGIGTCDNTTADARKLTGNDADFSFVGRYYAANTQIAEYYNFARTGFSTDDIRTAAAAKKDACNNLWNRTAPPLDLAVNVTKAAKAKGNAAYFIADGGVNNTNWTSVLSALAQCAGLDFAVNNLLAGAGNVGVKVKFYYAVPHVDATDPPLGLKKNIIKKGGSCFATVQVGGPFPQTWWTRVAVPAYDGPGSLNPSALSAQIKPDIAAAITAMLGAGADKIVWMLYYNMNPANVDIANLGLAWCRSQCPGWLSRRLPNTVTGLDAPLIEADLAGQVTTMTTDLNNVVKAAIPVNAKVKAMVAPVFVAADIQNTAIGGCPHPSDSGHTKLANTLSATYAGM